jgi:hypothetical protein
MLRHKRLGVVSLSLFALCLIVSPALVTAQEGSSSAARQSTNVKRDEVNYDVQLYLLAASNEATERGSGSLPQSLEGTVRQLRTSLPYTNYRLVTTFLNRVKDNGTVEMKGVGASLMPSQIGPSSPSFYDFTLHQVKMESDTAGQPFIRINRFRFGLRMPIVTGTARVEGSDVGSPIIHYESVGVTTELSLREGTPTVVGSMTTSRPGESLILLLSVRNSAAR